MPDLPARRPPEAPSPPPVVTAAGAAARRAPWSWVPSLYVAQGLPYAAVMTLSVVMLKNLGVGNADLAFLTGWLHLPWVLKPLWAALVEALGAARRWIVATQVVLALAFAGVALALAGARGGLDAGVALALAGFWVLAFASATHDIAADGFYARVLDERAQAAFVGVRSLAWRLASIGAQGGLVMLAGAWLATGTPAGVAWSRVFGLLALGFGVLAAWHAARLPRADDATPPRSTRAIARHVAQAWRSFFVRPGIARVLAFLLLDRLAEAQLVKLVVPFLLDARAAGGLALSTAQVGFVYGTLGVAALTLGGLAGGIAIARAGLARLWWPMVAALHAPNLLYVALAVAQPEGVAAPALAIVVEQAGYGFGFAAYLVFMLRLARGAHTVTHYAIATGLMALGMMLPGMVAGALQQALGYPRFFAFACACSVPAIAAAWWVRRDAARLDAAAA